MITFNSFILLGLLLRLLLVLIGTFVTVKIIGFENINFLKQYIRKHAFSPFKLFYWFVVFTSLVYFEHLISDADAITFSQVYAKNWFLSLLTTALLFGVIVHAFIEAKDSTTLAKETKKQLQSGKTLKKVLKIAESISPFVPNPLVKFPAMLISRAAHSYVDKKIEKNVSESIVKNIEIMLVIAITNLSIILIATYLITGNIAFW